MSVYLCGCAILIIIDFTHKILRLFGLLHIREIEIYVSGSEVVRCNPAECVQGKNTLPTKLCWDLTLCKSIARGHLIVCDAPRV